MLFIVVVGDEWQADCYMFLRRVCCESFQVFDYLFVAFACVFAVYAVVHVLDVYVPMGDVRQ